MAAGKNIKSVAWKNSIDHRVMLFIGIVSEAGKIEQFDIDMYFALVEKMTVYDGGRVIVSLLDGTDVACEIV